MQFINPIFLINYIYTTNDIGDTISIPQERRVLAHIASVRQSEFYQAQASGFKPELSLIIRSFEYKGEKSVRYGTKSFRILRTFDKQDGSIELTCIGAVNNAST